MKAPGIVLSCASASRTGLGLLLALGAIITYWPVHTHGFLCIDDDIYVTENRHVKAGLTAASVRWAFTSTEEANYWHPLTWLSHIMDVELYGESPGGHHVTSLLLHAANAILLFWVLSRLTDGRWSGIGEGGRKERAGPRREEGRRGSSAEIQPPFSSLFPAFLAAGLFALHPLHVECVAWISERKELLSTFFWLLTIGGYGRYAVVRCQVSGVGCQAESAGRMRRLLPSAFQFSDPSSRWYFLALLCFILGLMSKPMIVTLPFVLLLLDLWPLGRTRSGDIGTRNEGGFGQTTAMFGALRSAFRIWFGLIIEKLPFFALTVAASISTFRSQSAGDMLTPLETLGVGWRLANALTAYAGYLWQAVWPVGLTVYYPHPMAALPVWKPVGAVLLLACITAATLWQRLRMPYLLVGWLWYLGTLVPVIGLVQIGSFAMADRYTYVPLIGVFLMISGLMDQSRHRSTERGRQSKCSPGTAPVMLSLAILLVLAGMTRAQLAHWRDDQTLFQHQLRVTGGDMVGHNGLGLAALRAGRIDEAVSHFTEAIRLQPGLAGSYVQLGQALARQGQLTSAIKNYEQALRLNPRLVEAEMNLGIALSLQGATSEALKHLRTTTRLSPENADARSNLGVVLYRAGRVDEALLEMEEAVRLDPLNAAGHNNIGRMLLLSGKGFEAIPALREALRLDPNYGEARENLRQAMQAVGREE